MISRVLFFTTNNCQLCKPIKGKITAGDYPKAEIEFINEDVEKMYEYGVKAVPSIFVENRNELIVGQGKVLKYLEDNFV